jgi:2-iminobutanoate/2-iminopropanoate deaminase
MKTHLSIARGALTVLIAGAITFGSAAVRADDDHDGKVGISTTNAPAAIGPYSQAIRVGKTVYVSGEVGTDPATGLFPPTIDGQTEIGVQTDQALKNVGAILAAAGLSLDNVVATTVYLLDVNDFASMNAAYKSRFNPMVPYPARATIQVVAFPKKADAAGVLTRVEISAIAVAP